MDEPVTRRVNAKPFGADKAHALMVREEALRTMTRQEAFDKGYLTVKDLDDEELRYGRCRDRAGVIPGKGQTYARLIPQEKYDEMVMEHEFRFQERLRQNLDRMLDVMIEVAEDDTAEPRDRFQAASYLFERVAGKTAETVKHTVELKPWEGVLTDITGIGAISRSEHRRMQSEGLNAGIIDVEVVDENALPSEGVPASSQAATQSSLVRIHQSRPEQSGGQPETGLPEQEFEWSLPTPGDDAGGGAGDSGEVQSGSVGAGPGDGYQPGGPPDDEWRDPSESWAPVEVDTPDPYTQYGSKRTEKRSYAQQVKEAQDLAKKRQDSREMRKNAVKQRKIARATGADAIEDDITEMEIADDGKLTFE